MSRVSPDLECQGRLNPAVGSSAPIDLVAAVSAWLAAHHGHAVEATAARPTADGGATLELHLHPNDPGVRFAVDAAGHVRVNATTFYVGPGFRVFLGRLLRRLGADLGIEWQEAPPINPRAASEAAQLRLIEEAREVVDQLADEDRFPALLMSDTHRYLHNGLVATPVGPRDMKWLSAAAVGALSLDDAFVWARPGRGPRALRGRALSLMWTQVRWRRPQDEREQGVLERVDGLLDAAFSGEPNLSLPWAEWAEVQSLAGIETVLSDEVRRRASQSTSWPPVGYRRRAVEVRLRAGWWTRIPGSMAERWREPGVWEAWEPGRRLVLRLDTAAEAVPPLPLPAGERSEGLTHRSALGDGRAHVTASPTPAGVWRLIGHMQFRGSQVRVEADFEQARDRSWAEAAWRGLRCDGATQVRVRRAAPLRSR